MKVENEDIPKVRMQPVDNSLMTPIERGLEKKAKQQENFRISGGTKVEGKNVYLYANCGGVCELCYDTSHSEF